MRPTECTTEALRRLNVRISGRRTRDTRLFQGQRKPALVFPSLRTSEGAATRLQAACAVDSRVSLLDDVKL